MLKTLPNVIKLIINILVISPIVGKINENTKLKESFGMWDVAIRRD